MKCIWHDTVILPAEALKFQVSSSELSGSQDGSAVKAWISEHFVTEKYTVSGLVQHYSNMVRFLKEFLLCRGTQGETSNQEVVLRIDIFQK